MRDLTIDEVESVDGGIWQAVVAITAVAAWAWTNRADLMEVGDAAVAKNEQLNSEH